MNFWELLENFEFFKGFSVKYLNVAKIILNVLQYKKIMKETKCV